MAAKIWIVVTVMFFIMSLITYIVTPIFLIITGVVQTLIVGLNPTSQALSQSLLIIQLLTFCFTWGVTIGCLTYLLYGFLRPVAKEYESEEF